MYKEVSYIDDDGDEVFVSFPHKYEVCNRCEGHGTHLNPSIGNHAYTMEEFDESFSEDEDRAEYFKRGGIYDVTCEECKGARVIAVIDKDQCSSREKLLLADYKAYLKKLAYERMQDRKTMYYESGGYY